MRQRRPLPPRHRPVRLPRRLGGRAVPALRGPLQVSGRRCWRAGPSPGCGLGGARGGCGPEGDARRKVGRPGRAAPRCWRTICFRGGGRLGPGVFLYRAVTRFEAEVGVPRRGWGAASRLGTTKSLGSPNVSKPVCDTGPLGDKRGVKAKVERGASLTYTLGSSSPLSPRAC